MANYTQKGIILAEEPNDFPWFKWLALALAASMLFSCGAKKKAVQKEVRTQKNDIFVQEKEDLHNEIDLNKIIDRITIEPINPKVHNNVTFITGKDTFTVKGNNTRILRKTETVDSTATTDQKKETDLMDKSQIANRNIKKDIESEGWNWKGLNWFVVLLIILLALVFFYKLKR